MTSITKFPEVPINNCRDYWIAYVGSLIAAAQEIDETAVEAGACILDDAIAKGATIFSCGNGGSASIADHLVCDHLKGIRTGTDVAPHVISLASTVSLLTAIGNDIGYEEIFRFQLQSLAKPNDVLIAISSSGNSENIVRAVEWANDNGLKTICFTGFSGGRAATLASVSIHVPMANYGIVEDLHQAIMHGLAQYVRQRHMSGAQIENTNF